MLFLGIAYMHYDIYWFLHNLEINGKFPFENNLPIFFPAAWQSIHSHIMYLVPIVTYKLQSRLLGCKCKNTVSHEYVATERL